MYCTDLSSGISTNLDDTVHSATFAEADVRTALLGSQAIPASLESEHFDEKSTRSPVSLVYPDGYLAMGALAKSLCRDENLSSLSPVLESGSGSKGSLDLLTVSVSAACLDSPMLDLSNPLCNSGPGCSVAFSEAPNVAIEQGNSPSKTPRTNVQTVKTVCIRLYFLKFSEV
jgi:hypothetical protein